MIKNTEVIGNQAVVTYEFSEDDLKVLNHLKKHGYMEFKNYNENLIADNLYEHGFVESIDDSWHFTLKLTKLGQKIVDSMD